ncbi:phloem protein 2 A1-like [Pyrus ussuriensis x Pyrus communis]|uniref:Phloem protein 2 A1-like n=1 Tax=Pyrus ussuriensis x Pyrus communis TaxID=2448454 RepID=A0A5N5GKH3_9ROSA|nr:phloem protein 2 A1-like [Pyrus ussuriensis x Pyrus communis]
MYIVNNRVLYFYEQKSSKIWVKKNSGYKCMMLYARSLAITWDDNIKVAKLMGVRDLDVQGRFKMFELSPGVVYEIAYIVKLTNGVSGWELPITLKITLPGQGGTEKKRQYSLLEKPKGVWMELVGGSFQSMA